MTADAVSELRDDMRTLVAQQSQIQQTLVRLEAGAGELHRRLDRFIEADHETMVGRVKDLEGRVSKLESFKSSSLSWYGTVALAASGVGAAIMKFLGGLS